MESVAEATKTPVQRAYIDQIRTVMLVDDKFGTFAQLASSDFDRSGKEIDKATKLWSACRERGWTCDIENGPGFDDKSTLQRIGGADLVILDYHLVDNSPVESIEILQRLARSPRFNLVILYTVDSKLASVHMRVAANLRGSVVPDPSPQSPHAVAVWDELTARSDMPDILDERDFIELIARGRLERPDARNRLREKLGQSEVPAESLTPEVLDEVLRLVFDAYLGDELGAPVVQAPRPLRTSAHGAKCMWIQQGNLFVAFASKNEQSGSEVFKSLEIALEDWQPSSLHLAMAYARHSLIFEGGAMLDQSVLANPALHVGWIYHALEEGPPHGFRGLFERVLGTLNERILNDLAEFGSNLLPMETPSEPESRLAEARRLAHVGNDVASSDDVFAALNAFLCSTPYRGRHLTTGTVFCLADVDVAGNDRFWVCASPPCDMVPRAAERPSKWTQLLYPIRLVTTLVVRKCDYGDSLARPTEMRWIFFDLGDRPISAEVIDRQSRFPTPEAMLVAGGAQTDADGFFTAYRISKTQDGDGNDVPSFGPGVRMQAVAQLRPEYANRFLQEAGNYLSRIGADFINRPTSAKPRR